MRKNFKSNREKAIADWQSLLQKNQQHVMPVRKIEQNAGLILDMQSLSRLNHNSGLGEEYG